MAYKFNGNATHTLGVEIEMQLVDAQTFALANSISRILEIVPDKWRNQTKPELMQSCCEFNTDVCRTVRDVEADLGAKMAWAQETARGLGLHFAWSGSHPFSHWKDQVYTEGERYAWLADVMQYISRRLVVFGLHVHVGVDSGDKAIQLCERLLRHLPTLLALSANSPMWGGLDTGLASYRTKIMEALPTAGMPEPMRNWSEYVWLVDHLVATGFIKSIREIWWDVRPHHEFGTVEIRVMDMPVNMKHLLGLVALTQSLVAAISDHIDRGAYLPDCHPVIAKQNKWHASRYGLDATFVDPDTMLAVPARQMVRRLLKHCTPFAEKLDCTRELGYIEHILDEGTGAHQQRKILRKTNHMPDVARFLVEQAQYEPVG